MAFTSSPASADGAASPPERAGGWPTTLRFSRRLGESFRGPEYAVAVEGPHGPPPVHMELGSRPVREIARNLALLLDIAVRRVQ